MEGCSLLLLFLVTRFLVVAGMIDFIIIKEARTTGTLVLLWSSSISQYGRYVF